MFSLKVGEEVLAEVHTSLGRLGHLGVRRKFGLQPTVGDIVILLKEEPRLGLITEVTSPQ